MLPSNVVSITLQRDSGLIAAVCDDLVVRVVDIETRKVVRELGGFKGRVLDVVSFSPYTVLWKFTSRRRRCLQILDG